MAVQLLPRRAVGADIPVPSGQEVPVLTVATIGGQQAVQEAFLTIRRYADVMAVSIRHIPIKDPSGLKRAFSTPATFLILVSHGSPDGLVFPQGELLPWSAVASLINESRIPLICVAGCFSSNIPYVDKPVILFTKPVDARIAGLYLAGVIAKIANRPDILLKIAEKLLSPSMNKLAEKPELPLSEDSWTQVDSEVVRGYRRWLKVVGSLYQLEDADPNHDYYLAKVALFDMKWQNDGLVDPWFSTTWIGIRNGDQNSVQDFQPKPGYYGLMQISISFAIGISLYLPAQWVYYTEYKEYIGNAWCSRWDVKGAWPVDAALWFPPWISYSEYAVKYRVAEGDGITMQFAGWARWLRSFIVFAVVEGDDYTSCVMYSTDRVGD